MTDTKYIPRYQLRNNELQQSYASKRRLQSLIYISIFQKNADNLTCSHSPFHTVGAEDQKAGCAA